MQILPFGCGAHAATGAGSLAIVQFAGAPDLGAVYLGSASGGACLESERDAAAYARVFGQLKALALSPADSVLLLRGQEAA